MGKGSTAIQSDIERQRAALTARINRLERRVRDDVQSVKSETAAQARDVRDGVTSRASAAKEKAASTASSLRDGVTERPAGERAAEAASRAGEAIESHPMGTVTGALAVGAALGWLTGGGGESEAEGPAKPHRTVQLAEKGIGKGAHTVAEAVQAELAAFVKDFIDGALHGHQAAEPLDQPAALGSAWDKMQDRDLPRTAGDPPSVEAQVAASGLMM